MININKFALIAATIVFSILLNACQKNSAKTEDINNSKIEIEAEKKLN